MKLDTNALLKAAGIGAGGALVLALLGRIPYVGIACCCLVYLGFAGVGVLYTVFARQNNTPLDAGPMALGGAIAGAISGLLMGIVNGIFSAIQIGSGAIYNQLYMLEDAGLDLPPEVYDMYSGGAGTIIGAVCGSLCWGVIIAAILGAAGAAIFAATQKDKVPPPPPVE
nr:hypothetical protein [Anaerolineae bacterium]